MVGTSRRLVRRSQRCGRPGGSPLPTISSTESFRLGSPALPLVSAKALPHAVVEVKFSKGHSEGVNVYSERDGNNELVLLGRAVHSPYTDNRPLLVAGKPEVRKYRVIYVVNDKETGELSEEAVVTCQP